MKNQLEERLIEFSISIIHISENIKTDFASNHLYKQLIRSGTSVSLNYGEARAAESNKDFVHKMKVILKELRETYINLRLMLGAGIFESREIAIKIRNECDELIAIFVASLKTIEKRIKR